MALLKLGDEEIDIPKFKFREIKAAAPFFDRVVARRKELAAFGDASTPAHEIAARLAEMGSPMETMTNTLSDIVRIVAVGVLHARKEHPYTATSIEAQAQLIEGDISLDDFGVLNGTFDEIAREAGMLREVPTMALPEGAGATEVSASKSTD